MTHRLTPVEGMAQFAADVQAERRRQVNKWGPQNHPDGTGDIVDVYLRDDAKHETDDALSHQEVTWKLIAKEELLEAFAEKDPVRLRYELIQTAAVIQAWIADIDSRST